MTDVNGLRVVVAGAGAVGSVTALLLARAGAKVVLADPGGPNASAVAAGMLAPVCETLFDPLSAGHYPLYARARDAWAALAKAEATLPPLDRSGALIRPSSNAEAARLVAQAAAIGAALVRREGGLYTPEDWRLDPAPMLAALHTALAAAGGVRVAARALGITDGQVAFDAAPSQAAGALVQAVGHAGLAPIKGQILRFPGFGPPSGPVLRGQGVYAAPTPQGLVVGATMEEGLADLAIDPAAVDRLHAAALRLHPHLAGAPFIASAGVRGATADGLPLVGPSGPPGLVLAQGARRNGWLLAPLMAQVVIERLGGPAASDAARAFDPSRFVKD